MKLIILFEVILAILLVPTVMGLNIGESCTSNSQCEDIYYTNHGIFFGYCSNICLPADGIDGHLGVSNFLLGYTTGGNSSPYFGATYDLAGNQIDLYDNEGNWIRKIWYDILGTGLPYKTVSRESGILKSKFDSFGNILETRDSDGNFEFYTYDDLDRVTRIDYYIEGDEIPDFFVRNCHDYYCDTTTVCSDDGSSSFNLLCEVQDSTGSTKWAYDMKSRTVSEIKEITIGDVGTQVFTRQFAYTPADLLDTQTLPSGLVIDYIYDDLGQLTGIIYDGEYIGEASYTAFGGIEQRLLGSQEVISDFYYDNRNRLTALDYSMPGNPGFSFERTILYDKMDNVRKIQYDVDDSNPGTWLGWMGNEIFQYDNLYRLYTAEYAGDITFTYGYDNKLGDRSVLTTNQDNTETTYIYSANRHLTSLTTISNDPQIVGTTSYNYDFIGNIERIRETYGSNPSADTFYHYDPLNRMSRVDTSSGTTEYFYDYANHRILKRERDDTHTFYLYHGDQVILEKKITT